VPPALDEPPIDDVNLVADDDSDDDAEATDALNSDLMVEAGFPAGDWLMPTVAQALGRHLADLPHVPALSWSALTPETRASHRRALQGLSALAPNQRLATVCVEMLRRAALERRWRWATTLRNAATLQGALANLL